MSLFLWTAIKLMAILALWLVYCGICYAWENNRSSTYSKKEK